MKLHNCVSLPLVVAWGLLASVSWGQVTLLPGAVKTSTSPPMDQIETFINTQVDLLKDNSNPQGQSNARDSLIAATSGQTSPIFQELYSIALNAALKNVATDPQMRVRLNGAIVAAHVAEKVNNAKLAEAVMLFMNDSSEAVVLWGIKAARFIIPAALQGGGQNSPIVKALTVVLKAHPAGAVIQDAYGAFDPPRGATPQVLALAARQMVLLLETRIAQYQKSLPEDPSAEIVPVVFLSASRMWEPGVLTTVEKVKIMQDLSDLLGLLGQRAQGTGGQELVKLIPLVITEGKAFFVIGGNMQNPALQAAANPLAKLPFTASGPDISNLIQAVHPAIVTIPMFKDVTPPPQIAPAAEAAATEPSTK